MPVVTLYKFPDTQEDLLTTWFRAWKRVTAPFAHLFGDAEEFKAFVTAKMNTERSWFYDWDGNRVSVDQRAKPAFSVVWDEDEMKDDSIAQKIELADLGVYAQQITFFPAEGDVAKAPAQETSSDCYELITNPVRDQIRDWMWFQINRPDTEEPFTVLLKSFGETGYEPAFAHLFHSKDWGLFKGDYEFLEQLWEVFYPDREYNLEEIKKKWVNACYPSEGHIPFEEPMVFRKPISKLLKISSDDGMEIDLSRNKSVNEIEFTE